MQIDKFQQRLFFVLIRIMHLDYFDNIYVNFQNIQHGGANDIVNDAYSKRVGIFVPKHD